MVGRDCGNDLAERGIAPGTGLLALQLVSQIGRSGSYGERGRRPPHLDLIDGETGDVVELLEKLCSHRMLEEVGSGSGIDSPLGKPLQHLHIQGITEPTIQFIPLIQQRPLVAP